MADVIKRVIVWLYKNVLTPATNDRYGKVQHTGIMDTKAVAIRFKKEGSESQLETIEDTVNRADRIRREALLEGLTVHTGFVNASLGVQGSFTSNEFDRSKHRLVVKSSPSAVLRKAVEGLSVQMMGDAQTGIAIQSITDELSGEVNGSITPGDLITIVGDRLQIAGDHAEVGVYLTNVDDNSRTQIERVVRNRGKELLLKLPSLAPGDYQLEIVTQWSSGGKTLKEPIRGTFDEILSVV